MKWLFRFIEIIFIAVLLLIAINFRLVGYGLSQLHGQLRIIFYAKPISEIISNASVSDSLKNKLLLVKQIKQFAVDSLGLESTENYTTYYDQQGKSLLMVLSASEKFQLKAFEWKFPFLGNVSYKGFFNFKKGEVEKKELDEKGYDTDYGATGAWSTLGWFRDPVFSGMLRRNEGQLAELIIHEMTHGTIYLRSSVDFNENLASVVGEEGAERFLEATFGSNSKQMKNYLDGKEDYDVFSQHILRGASKLDSLYGSFPKTSTMAEKDTLKKSMLIQIISSLDTITFHHPEKYHLQFSTTNLPNNAYFMSYKRYDAQKDEMKKELKAKFGGDISTYLEYLKERNQ